MKTMNKLYAVFILYSVFALGGCAHVSPQAVGADLDAHECVVSGGYTWSSVRGRCLRLWEEGIALKDAQNPKASFVAYAVLSDSGAQAELFLPGQSPSVMLDRSFTQRGPRWSRADSPWLLERLPEGWRLFENGRLVYWAGNPGGLR